jgi:preprotein translocase subunit SecA
VLDRLVGVLDALERFDEADEMARQVDALKQAGAGASRERTGERGRVQPPEEQPEDEGTVVREGPKVGRNDPCPCGSGKKYKKCCGK